MKIPVAIVKGEDTEENVEKTLTLIDIKSNLRMNNYLPTMFNKPSEYINSMKLRKDSKILIKPNIVKVEGIAPPTTYFGRRVRSRRLAR